MITIDSAGRIRISRQVSKSAGFRPSQKLAVVAEGQDTFQIRPAKKVGKNVNSARYSVEKDGRIRVSMNAVEQLGVKSNQNTISVDAQKGIIVVTM